MTVMQKNPGNWTIFDKQEVIRKYQEESAIRCDRIGGITEYVFQFFSMIPPMFFMGSDATSLADLVLGRTWSGQQMSVLKAGQIQSDWKCACRICAYSPI